MTRPQDSKTAIPAIPADREESAGSSVEHQNGVPFVPEYAAPLQAELTRNHHLLARVAACFGALPLTLGCLDFLLWIPTRAEIFVSGGVLIILLGLLCTFVGGLLLLIQLCSLRGTGRLKVFFKNSRLALFLLIVNYPVAFGIILLVGQMMGPMD